MIGDYFIKVPKKTKQKLLQKYSQKIRAFTFLLDFVSLIYKRIPYPSCMI